MTWEADSQMVRSRDEDGFNLSIGEPFFLRNVMKDFYSSVHMGRNSSINLGYPDIHPEPALRLELQMMYPDKEVVVTCGAKQALHAAVYALTQTQVYSHLSHRAPHWPTHPTIAAYAGLDFDPRFCFDFDPCPLGPALTVNSTPNNPDGTESVESCDIWDACYAHRVYGWTGLIPEHKISVWSAGKMLGVPGARVGWLLTEDKELAAAARRYVEQTTSGVSTLDQEFIAKALANTEPYRARLFEEARNTLFQTSSHFLLLAALKDCPFAEIQGFPVTGKGMFAWVRAKNPEDFERVLAKAKVRVVGGKACGGDADWYRISLGVTPEYMLAAVKAIMEAIDNGKA